MNIFDVMRFFGIPIYLLIVIAFAAQDMRRGRVTVPGLYLVAVLFAILYLLVRIWMKEDEKAMSRTEPNESERAIVRAEEHEQARMKKPADEPLK